MRLAQRSTALAACLACSTASASAQTAPPETVVESVPAAPADDPGRTLSMNAMALAGGHVSGEFERRVAAAFTLGVAVGASRETAQLWSSTREMTVHEGHFAAYDVLARWYVGGCAFRGVSIVLRTGLTTLPGEGTFPGLGLELHHSWPIGARGTSSVGFGPKRVFGGSGTALDQRYLPMLRVSFGVRF